MDRQKACFTRRTAIGGIAATAALAAAGCGRSATQGSRQPEAKTSAIAVQAAAMTVYRDPGCGCCEAWTGLARNAGYQVSLIDSADMPAIKRKYGVPEGLLSCHTAVVGDYVVEGHVPLEHVKRLLAQRPTGVKGIAVPGMPAGSPGMEVPDGTKQPFEVMAFDTAGKVSAFTA